MNKRISKKNLLENVNEATLAMDMETYKKEKNSLDKEDNVIIKDEEKNIHEVEETEIDNYGNNDNKIFEQFIRIVNK